MTGLAKAAVDQGGGFDLRSVVIGAIIGGLVALASQAFLQLYVIPRADARRRREDRWERDVLALGELLTHEMPDAVSSLRYQTWWLGTLKTDDFPDAVPERLAEARRSAAAELRAATDVVARLDLRVDWLTERIGDLAPTHPLLSEFGGKSRHAQHTLLVLRTQQWSLDHHPPEFDNDRLESTYEQTTDRLSELLKLVKGLAVLPVPPRRRSRLASRLLVARETTQRSWERLRHPKRFKVDGKPQS